MSVELALQDLLTKFPKARQSRNFFLFAYWLKVDGYGTRQKDFRQTTDADTILREARTLFRKRPDLSPEMYAEQEKHKNDFADLVGDLFPGARKA